MRIERVVARAFGPFRDATLALAPGLTVVVGPNEAGKSSWHAALRLALTGVRRGKGPGTAAERQLAERHRPWDAPERWEVEARVQLADGRTIDISHDLAGKVACRAVDVGLGRDVSDEILDGTPDASRWLGLDRDTFAATASVSQSQILAVTDAAEQLQEQMQRAAATRGADATAAEALARLDQFRRDAVGVDRAGARGPLRTARERAVAAEAHLAEARRLHAEFLERAAESEAADQGLAAARAEAAALEAALARARAAQSAARIGRARELAARHPAPPEALAVADERADAVASALDAWVSRPPLVLLEGPSAADLEAEIEGLPPAPDGDLEPHPTTAEAARQLDLLDVAIDGLDELPRAAPDPLPAVPEARVRELARRLRQPSVPGADAREAELAEARRQAGRARTTPRPLPLAAAALALAALALLAGGQLGLALATAAGAAVAGGAGWWLGAAGRRAADRLSAAERALDPYRRALALAEEDVHAAAAEARAAGLPTEPAELDSIADRKAAADAARRAEADRERRRAGLEARRRAARQALAAQLRARGAPVEDDPRRALAEYRAACRGRAAQAAEAARRGPLEHQLAARRAAERSAAHASAAVATAERRLRDAAAAIGVADGPPDELVAALRGWQADRLARLRQGEAAIAEWQQLQALLGEGGLDDLEDEARRAKAAAELVARVSGLGALPDGTPVELEARLAAARHQLSARASAADELRGSVWARREGLPDVAEAEEAVQAAAAELERVQRLAHVLERTSALLRAAEERVHRSLAPVLAEGVARWLPAVSGGAYSDVSVDPADLAVHVKEATSGAWREARLLSEGTREQIYLLLRVAMANRLVTNGEVAPLLLDEVTVQSDPERKLQLLGVLHRISVERQVVLFTHDDDVLAWAERHLSTGRDAIVRLPARRSEPPAASEPRELDDAVAVAD